MPSNVGICNTALAHLGDQKIESLDSSLEPNNRLVELCNIYLPQARDELLESLPWTFARKRAALSATTAPVFEWTYAHSLPADCLRILELRSGSNYDSRLEDFHIEGAVIMSDSQFVGAIYVHQATAAENYSASFAGALARLLASYLSGPVKGDPRESDRHRQHYLQVDLPKAQYEDQVQDRANENEINRRRGQLYTRHFYGSGSWR